MPAPRSALALSVVQAANTGGGGGGGGDEAIHNWDNVLCVYNHGSAGIEVDEAFMRAGYSDTSTRRKAILKAIREKGWARSQIAHSKGGQESGKRGGTDTKIQQCKKDLLEWLKTHPGGSTTTTISGGGKRRKGGRTQVDEEQVDKASLNAILFARWIKEGDQGFMEPLRLLAKSGNETAIKKLAELEPPTVSSSISSLPHLHSPTTTTTTTTTPTPIPVMTTTTTPSLAVHPPPQIGVPPLTVRQLELLYPGQTAGGQSFGIWGVDHASW